LKWGVGKLIAKSPTVPIVVPIFHVNMQVLKLIFANVEYRRQRLNYHSIS
jgi:hypothetical protein